MIRSKHSFTPIRPVTWDLNITGDLKVPKLLTQFVRSQYFSHYSMTLLLWWLSALVSLMSGFAGEVFVCYTNMFQLNFFVHQLNAQRKNKELSTLECSFRYYIPCESRKRLYQLSLIGAMTFSILSSTFSRVAITLITGIFRCCDLILCPTLNIFITGTKKFTILLNLSFLCLVSLILKSEA